GLTYGVASAVCHSLKAIIKRERPFVASNSVVNMLPANGFSMPSGHSVSAAVITTFLLYLIISSNLKKRTKAVLGTLTSLILPLVMLSRMFLGQHYLSDTIVGAVIGVAIAIGGIFVFRFVSRRFLNGHRKNS
ncbi:MAG: phosphatase PAP2 family protein, partial [Clostridia bacterium]